MSLEEEIKKLVYDTVIEAMKDFQTKQEPTPVQQESKILYSIRGLANFLGCSTVTAQRLKNSGRIPYWQIGRKVMFDSTKVLNAMEHSEKKIRYKH